MGFRGMTLCESCHACPSKRIASGTIEIPAHADVRIDRHAHTRTLAWCVGLSLLVQLIWAVMQSDATLGKPGFRKWS